MKLPSLRDTIGQHLCSGAWRVGTVKDCAACQASRKPRPVKRSSES